MTDRHLLAPGTTLGDLVASSPEHDETSILTLVGEVASVLVLLPSLTGRGSRSVLRAAAAAAPVLRTAGAEPVAVGPGDRSEAATMVEHLDLPFALLAAEPGDSARRLWPGPHPGRWRSGYRVAVIDRKGTVRQMQRSLRPAQAVAVDGIVACLRSLQGQAS